MFWAVVMTTLAVPTVGATMYHISVLSPPPPGLFAEASSVSAWPPYVTEVMLVVSPWTATVTTRSRSAPAATVSLQVSDVPAAVEAELVVPAATELLSLTSRLAVSVAVENAVVPPFVLVLAAPPLTPLVRSHARNVMASAIEPL